MNTRKIVRSGILIVLLTFLWGVMMSCESPLAEIDSSPDPQPPVAEEPETPPAPPSGTIFPRLTP